MKHTVTKETSTDENKKESFLETSFNVWIHLTELHLCFMLQSINTVFQEPEKGFLDCTESSHKGNFIRSKLERSFLRKFFLICEFISQSYNLCLMKQFANTLLEESVKWYLVAHRGPWWKWKCPRIITTGKLSERLLSDVWLHHTEFHPSLLGTVC